MSCMRNSLLVQVAQYIYYPLSEEIWRRSLLKWFFFQFKSMSSCSRMNVQFKESLKLHSSRPSIFCRLVNFDQIRIQHP